MELQNKKCVMIIDEALPLGLIANTAGILGMTLGKLNPETVGPDVQDQSGRAHLGIVALPVPVLKADGEKIRAIREQLYQPQFSELTAVDFSDVAQGCKNYGEFTEKAANTEEGALAYFGLGICGDKKLVNKLTGNLPLLR
ncbi:DUF2000 domain-containing protein [Harryflintia acetispora]|uniref:DUF2000 domain-containing protein n=1 Tax=Harryflintia acetispora TaxID=1849041 RepID=A0A9X8Y8G2_9FIRM|nr:DUF2000 domain-containing protein [Harryflintia acetispora]TCL43677.1 hypothetical protein EDD78_10411 [Harryflintia acetispora]